MFGKSSVVGRVFARAWMSTAAAGSKPQHYETLRLPTTATPKEIKSQYYKLSMKYHPDRNLDGVEDPNHLEFSKISEAYNILGDESKRRTYDASIGIGLKSTTYNAKTSTRTSSSSFHFHPNSYVRYNRQEHQSQHYGQHFKSRRQLEEENDQFRRTRKGSNFLLVLALVMGTIGLSRLLVLPS